MGETVAQKRKSYHQNWRERKKQDPQWLLAERERCRLKSKMQRERDPRGHSIALREWRRKRIASVLVSQTRSRAKRIGVACDVDVPFVQSLLDTVSYCPYTKVCFKTPKPDGLRMNPWAPSLDRIDSVKGYTRDNIELVSNWWNLAKHEWPAEVVQAALAGLRS